VPTILRRSSRGYHALSNADNNTNIRKLNLEFGGVDNISIHQTTGIIQRNFCVDILLFSP